MRWRRCATPDIDEIADRIQTELVGRNVLAGRWTFQIVEEYDDTYWTLFRDLERAARDELAGGVRHLYEARLKQSERSVGRPGHEAGPGDRYRPDRTPRSPTS